MTSASCICARIAVCCLLFILHRSSVIGAQEVQWRRDYADARREAAEKQRPLLIDFGTENCFWCKQLDARTFRDPAVVSLLNERFIPLKIDAEHDADLANRLRIQNYPTLVIASADGKILNTLEGFQEAGKLQGNLQSALGGPPRDDWMTRDYQEATRAVAGSDFARAVALLKGVGADGRDRPVQVQARRLLQDLEQQAAARLTRAQQLAEQGQTAEARAVVQELVRVYAGTPAAVEGGQLLTTWASRAEERPELRAHRARELLAQAREDYRGQQFLCCLDRCEHLSAHYGDLPEGAQAVELAAEIKSNHEWMKQASDVLSDRLGTLYLSLAETSLKNGQPHQAVIYLERVLQAFPGTRQAEAAQLRLLQIQDSPTRPVDYKDP